MARKLLLEPLLLSMGEEYSESVGINPTGLFSLIYKFHKRYNLRLVHRNVDQPNYGKTIPFVITENGISDATDILRPSYLIEHLKAIQKLISVGVPINGYIFGQSVITGNGLMVIVLNLDSLKWIVQSSFNETCETILSYLKKSSKHAKSP